MTVSSPSADRIGLQSGRAVFVRSLEAFLPPEAVSVADFATSNRWLNNPGVNVGRWQHSETPYLVGPMRSLTSTTQLTSVVVGAARAGKTSIAENWLLYSVGSDPANMLWYMPTDTAMAAYVKQDINPMIERHHIMKTRLGQRAVDNSLGFKKFRAMTVQFLTATYANLINKTTTRIVLDEIDAMLASLGDVYALADLRRWSAGSASMVLVTSHPDRARSLAEDGWDTGIMRLYRGSDRHVWYWPCPHCDGYSSPNPTADRVMVLDYPEDAPLEVIERDTVLICPCCGADVHDHHRREMNIGGKWVGSGQTIDEDGTIRGDLIDTKVSGWWITGHMSPFVIGGIGALVRAEVEAKRAYYASETEENLRAWKEVVVKRFGVPFSVPRKGDQVDAQAIVERAEPGLSRKTVPIGVRFITVAIDVQATRFEVMARGWGEHRESWIIDKFVVKADTSVSPIDWDELFALVSALQYPVADGTGRWMKVRAIGCDSGGAAGATLLAYEAWRRAKLSHKAALAGRIDGREAWTLLLLKGASGPNASTIAISYPDSARKDRGAAARGQVPLGLFAPNRFKDDLAAQLSNAEPGPGYIHIPAGFKSEHPPHGFFDQLVAEIRKPDGRWVKSSPSVRNENLDLMVMCHAMAHLWGLARINWSSPPAWAGPWDDNPLVVPGDAVPELVATLVKLMRDPASTDETDETSPPAPVARPIKRQSLADMWS